MTADPVLVEQLVGLVERSRITEFEYRKDEDHIHIVKAADGSARMVDEGTPGEYVITAGIVGTFFRASGPDDPVFAAIGDTVQEGQILAIIESMKVMNPVEADGPGRIIAIPAENGASVSVGTPLFVMVPL